MNSLDSNTVREITRKDIDRELTNLVEVSREVVPFLKEVRIFGSYLTDKWDSESSDVDVFVEIGNNDYSIDVGVRPLPDYHALESEQRQEVRNRIKERLNPDYAGVFNIHLLSSSDVRNYWNYEEGSRGPLGKTMKGGKLLYKAPSELKKVLSKLKF